MILFTSFRFFTCGHAGHNLVRVVVVVVVVVVLVGWGRQYLKRHPGALRKPPIDLLINIKVFANIKINNFYY
jgi:hypothetical protein